MRIAYHDKLSLGADEWISLSKPKQVFNCCYEAWRDTLLPVEPMGFHDFARVHSSTFVEKVLRGDEVNGFGNTRPEVTEQVCYAHGAMYAAAKAALEHGVAFAPVSGFHHAGYDYNGGYCTFNGLLTTVAKLRAEDGFNGSVVILDFDGHTGDGTMNILQTFGNGSSCALGEVYHFTRGAPFKEAVSATRNALQELLAIKPALVLYQAGADSIRGDPFGAGYFTPRMWDARDRAIFECCHDLKLPIAWNLAGGYNGKETVMAHYRTFRSAVEVFDGETPTHLADTPTPGAGQG